MKTLRFIGILLILWQAVSSIAATTTIPFRLVGNLIIIHATVEGQTGNFILDSGIPHMILNDAYFKGEIPANGFRFIDGETQSSKGMIALLRVGELSIKDYASVIDLSAIEKQKGMKLLGFLALRTFRKYELIIDYFPQKIDFYRLDRKGNRQEPMLDPGPVETLFFQYKAHILYIKAYIDGKELKMGVDTGAEVNILSPEWEKKILDRIDVRDNQILMGLDGKQIQTSAARVRNLQVGNHFLPPMETIFVSIIPINKLSGPKLDGILGPEFLKHFRTTFNFKKKTICLWKEEALDQLPVASDRK